MPNLISKQLCLLSLENAAQDELATNPNSTPNRL